MTWTPLPGIRQDHRGRNYRYIRNSRGKIDTQPVEIVEREIKIHLLGDFRGHLWTISPQEFSVTSCGQPLCTICAPKRKTPYSIKDTK